MDKLKECLTAMICDRSYQGCFNPSLRGKGCDKCLNLLLEEHDEKIRKKVLEELSMKSDFKEDKIMDKITVNKLDVKNLISYIHALFDFIDVDDFEDEENKKLVRDGYDNFVNPIVKMVYEDEEIKE